MSMDPLRASADAPFAGGEVKDSSAPLMHAASRGDAVLCRLLLANDTSANSSDERGRSPLHATCAEATGAPRLYAAGRAPCLGAGTSGSGAEP
ncbi:hypothetical protein T492DRAFT_1032949 [Pavlovales sp. CCMP2436]|nr:hypothetical protein T492DRAFT_1032949 [Pavlovales sp. CCMP2436]